MLRAISPLMSRPVLVLTVNTGYDDDGVGDEVIEEEEDEDEDGEEGGDEDSDAEEEESDDEEGEEGEDENENREEKMLTLEEKKEKARAMTLSKILTDEDFKKIDAAQLKKQVTGLV